MLNNGKVVISSANGTPDAEVITRPDAKSALVADSTITGGTTGAAIGNIGDRLKTDSTVTISGGTAFSWSKKLRYDDMNVSNGGVARGTSITAAAGWVQTYSYTGTGYLIGAQMSLEGGTDWAIRVQVDGDEIFGANGISGDDMNTAEIYDMRAFGKQIPELDQEIGLFWGTNDRWQWHGPFLIPVRFETNVKVFLRRDVGAAARNFQAGLAVIVKET